MMVANPMLDHQAERPRRKKDEERGSEALTDLHQQHRQQHKEQERYTHRQLKVNQSLLVSISLPQPSSTTHAIKVLIDT